MLTKHSSGLSLLQRPVQLEDISLITPDDLQRVIGLLKATFIAKQEIQSVTNRQSPNS